MTAPIERRIQHQTRSFCREWPSLAVLLSMILLLVLNHAVFGLPGQGRFMPWLVSGGVFCWAMFNPGLFRWYQVFLFGLMQDFILGTPLGLTALALLIVYRLGIHQRRYLMGKPFRVVWVGYGVVLAISLILQAMIMYLIGAYLTIWIAVSWGMSFLLFPPVHRGMRVLYERIMQPQ